METETAVEKSSASRPGILPTSMSASRIAGSSPRHTWAFEWTCAWTRSFAVLRRRGLELFSISDAVQTFSLSTRRTQNNLSRHTKKVTSHDAIISDACLFRLVRSSSGSRSDLAQIEKESENKNCSKNRTKSKSTVGTRTRFFLHSVTNLFSSTEKKFSVYFGVASEDEKQHDTGLHGGDFCSPLAHVQQKRDRWGEKTAQDPNKRLRRRFCPFCGRVQRSGRS